MSVDLAALAKSEGLWLHVDAAYGGAARLSPRDAARVPGHRSSIRCNESSARSTNHVMRAFVTVTALDADVVAQHVLQGQRLVDRHLLGPGHRDDARPFRVGDHRVDRTALAGDAAHARGLGEGPLGPGRADGPRRRIDRR